mmetsp:Transcript_46814/g.111380  ORF Transcript_46814/g.111380 Transcript_46814/m.111380 type:complete len:131 (+) Transcript_46814:72-464(+)
MEPGGEHSAKAHSRRVQDICRGASTIQGQPQAKSRVTSCRLWHRQSLRLPATSDLPHTPFCCCSECEQNLQRMTSKQSYIMSWRRGPLQEQCRQAAWYQAQSVSVAEHNGSEQASGTEWCLPQSGSGSFA